MILGKFATTVREKLHGSQQAEVEEEVVKELQLYTREGKFYILIVDSGEENVRLIRETAEKTGCEVTVAENGIACMEKAMKDRYDVILLTLSMARMDGLQTLHNLRSVGGSRCRDSRVYCMLETDEKRDEAELLADGFSGVVRKPVQEAAILDIIVRNAPQKMLPDDEEFLEEIKTRAEDARKLEGAGIFLSSGLASCGGDMNLYREAAKTFTENYRERSLAAASSLFAAEEREYMDLVREEREACRELGVSRLSDAFDDHVNMAKDGELEIAELHLHKVMEEWEAVVGRFAEWLDIPKPESRIDEIFHAKTNGIRLSNKDVLERIEMILDSLKETEVVIAGERITKTLNYALKDITRHKLFVAREEIYNGRLERASAILSAML